MRVRMGSRVWCSVGCYDAGFWGHFSLFLFSFFCWMWCYLFVGCWLSGLVVAPKIQLANVKDLGWMACCLIRRDVLPFISLSRKKFVTCNTYRTWGLNSRRPRHRSGRAIVALYLFRTSHDSDHVNTTNKQSSSVQYSKAINSINQTKPR